ncbi:MAG: hypothetical protein U0163_19595 [Gemmatimonadaceae bacterium]
MTQSGGPIGAASSPACRKCGGGVLLPLSDYGRDGAEMLYKAWICSNPLCGFNLRIDNGVVSYGRLVGKPEER